MLDLTPLTLAIIAVNVIISYKGFNDFSFFEKYKFNIAGIKRGERLRMLTSGFLHADTTHLLFNMISFYFFADLVIASLGRFNFIILYLGSLLCGNLLSFYFHKKALSYSAVGASGAVMGVIYAAILLHPDMRLGLFFIPIPIPGYLFGIGYLLYTIYGMKKRIGNIGHDAHFGGAIGGYVITLALAPWVWRVNSLNVLLLAIPICILYILKRNNQI